MLTVLCVVPVTLTCRVWGLGLDFFKVLGFSIQGLRAYEWFLVVLQGFFSGHAV